MPFEELSTVELNAIERHVLDVETGKRKCVRLSGRAARALLGMAAGKHIEEQLEQADKDRREAEDEAEKASGEAEAKDREIEELKEQLEKAKDDLDDANRRAEEAERDVEVAA